MPNHKITMAKSLFLSRGPLGFPSLTHSLSQVRHKSESLAKCTQLLSDFSSRIRCRARRERSDWGSMHFFFFCFFFCGGGGGPDRAKDPDSGHNVYEGADNCSLRESDPAPRQAHAHYDRVIDCVGPIFLLTHCLISRLGHRVHRYN